MVPDGIDENIRVTGITSDSRDVKQGYLFVAIPGYEKDGHNFIEESISKGARVVVVERDVGEKSAPILRVNDTRRVLALLAHRFYGNPSKELLLVGITGTNGKTTVSFLLESILTTGGMETGLMGTMVYRWKDSEETAERTTPGAVDLHRLLRRMRDDGVEVVVMEVSSHALALDRVLGMTFRVAVFTNLSRDHLDFHSSFRDYAETKAKLFGMLSSDGVGIINGDDPAGRQMVREAKGRTVTFGEKARHLDYRVEGVKEGEGETRFSLVGERRRVTLSTPLLGKFNAMNAAAAGIAGLELGVDEDAVREGLRKVRSVPGRMEGFDSRQGFRVVVDYAHTPDALRCVLVAAREFTEKRLIVVFGCGGERDRGKRPEMGRIAASLADVVFITSDNPRREDPAVILQDILEGIDSAGKVETVVDREEAIHRALDRAREGDVVVIAGKGHETYQEIGSERISFNDRAVAEAYLGLKEGA